MSGKPELAGQTVVVIGGSSGIGLETARLARAEGADLILTARDPDRLRRATSELGALSTAAFDATDFERLGRFFDDLPWPIDHVLVTGPGPYYAPLAEFDVEAARRDVDAHLLLPLQVARNAASKVRPGGSLIFMGGTGGRRTAPGLAFISALTAGLPALTRNLALELAPSGIRANYFNADFIDTPMMRKMIQDRAAAKGISTEAQVEEYRKRNLLGVGPIPPEAVAEAALFLASDRSRYTTGSVITVDGGLRDAMPR